MNNLTFFELQLPRHSSDDRGEQVFVTLLEKLSQVAEGVAFSLELVGKGRFSRFLLGVPSDNPALFTDLVFASYPNAEIKQVEEPSPNLNQAVCGCEIKSRYKDIYPFRTFADFDSDTLAPLLNFIAESGDGDETYLQLCLRSVPYRLSLAEIGRIVTRKFTFYGKFLGNLFSPAKASVEVKRESSQEKLNSARFEARIIIGCSAETLPLAKRRLQHLQRLLKVFKASTNELTFSRKHSQASFVELYGRRNPHKLFELSAQEVATLFHLPSGSETGHTIAVNSKKGEPPWNLPTAKGGENISNTNVSLFGETNYRNKRLPFGFKFEDRRRHLYIIGKSGSGKSKLMELLIGNDIASKQGLCVLDPHGDLVDEVLEFIPEDRIKDVVLFDPTDSDNPIAFNPLAKTSDAYKTQITIGLIDIFKKLFAANWNPRLEHLLRHIILALLDTPDTTLLSIEKMLTDKAYRRQIVANIKEPNIKQFWTNEFAAWNERYTADAINPLVNKIGQLSSNRMVRNILGQPDMRFDFRQIIDEGKILLIKLPKGLLGEEVTALLGALMVTKLYQAAMQRADMAESQRRDFYFFIDEFQNFSTDTFANILAEARKYRLNMTLTHQYLGQLSENILKTVFGNVGSIICFRTGAEDAKVFAKEFAPRFDEQDIINLSMRDFYTKMSIDGEVQEAFSGRSLDVKSPEHNNKIAIIKHNHSSYCRSKKEVEELLAAWEATGQFKSASNKVDSKKFKEPLL